MAFTQNTKNKLVGIGKLPAPFYWKAYKENRTKSPQKHHEYESHEHSAHSVWFHP